MLLSALFSGAGAAAGLAPTGLALACFGAGFLAAAFFGIFFRLARFALVRLAAEADAPDFVRLGFWVAR